MTPWTDEKAFWTPCIDDHTKLAEVVFAEDARALEISMTPDKLALLFYMAGSVCFFLGSLVLWFK